MRTSGWQGLGLFWALVLAVVGAGGITLQILGPPTPHPVVTAAREPAHPPPAVEPAKPAESVATSPGRRRTRETPGPIAEPDPALLEPLAGDPGAYLPRIGADGRTPMQAYAAGFDRDNKRPWVGILLAGVGLNRADSEAAIKALPGGVTLAVSPYAADMLPLLAAIRSAQHEFLLSIPMEPQGFPLNDPGPRALMTNLPQAENHTRLDWLLSRIAGYVGVTGALGAMRGERFAGMPEQMRPVTAELVQRGLLYVEPRPYDPDREIEAPPGLWLRQVDLVVDEPVGAPQIDDKLARLTQLARDKGSALGLVGAVRPLTTDRIAAWIASLAGEGVVLAPVSALVQRANSNPQTQ